MGGGLIVRTRACPLPPPHPTTLAPYCCWYCLHRFSLMGWGWVGGEERECRAVVVKPFRRRWRRSLILIIYTYPISLQVQKTPLATILKPYNCYNTQMILLEIRVVESTRLYQYSLYALCILIYNTRKMLIILHCNKCGARKSGGGDITRVSTIHQCLT